MKKNENKFICLNLMGYEIEYSDLTFTVIFRITKHYSIMKGYENEVMDENFIVERIVKEMNEEIKKFVNFIRS